MKEPEEEKRPLRVLFLTPYFRPYLGGIERAIEQLAFQLLESGEVVEVGVLTTKYSFPREAQPQWADRETTPEGIAIYRLKGFPSGPFPCIRSPWYGFHPARLTGISMSLTRMWSTSWVMGGFGATFGRGSGTGAGPSSCSRRHSMYCPGPGGGCGPSTFWFAT